MNITLEAKPELTEQEWGIVEIIDTLMKANDLVNRWGTDDWDYMAYQMDNRPYKKIHDVTMELLHGLFGGELGDWLFSQSLESARTVKSLLESDLAMFYERG